ncbi:MAG: hypothetical protein IJB48_05785 [Clostridia bacterium]|nr:hypothetical protein [Clostridia bacterium]MBQ4143023.1 hypothetical protein [Thermoguttaceae bacterium]
MKNVNLKKVCDLLVACHMELLYGDDLQHNETLEKWRSLVEMVDVFLGCGEKLDKASDKICDQLEKESETTIGRKLYEKTETTTHKEFFEILSK